jgi:hypothetical protein
MSALHDLLVVQGHDSAADRLRHRRVTLPERAALVGAQQAKSEVDARLAETRAQRDAVLHDEKRLDDEATALEEKAKEVERKLYGGTVSSPRELQAMQADVEQLRRHRGDLEDRELEIMEQREALDGAVAALEREAAEREHEIDALTTTITANEHEIDTELATEVAARATALATVPAELLGLYEQVRAKNKGVGVARLVGDTCQGCHLSLPATDVDRIRRLPADTVARCDNCGAILVQ